MKSAVTGLVVLFSGLAAGQAVTPPAEFEVADVQVSKPGTKQDVQIVSARITAYAISLKDVITFAYGVEDNMVTGPSWLDTDKFDIVAKAPPNATDQQLQPMVRTLLAQRFGLVAHMENKTVPVYALVVGKKGPKLEAAAGSAPADCKFHLVNDVRTFTCTNMTIQDLAGRIRSMAAAYIDHPVVNLTDIKGAFDFTLAWTGRGKLLGTAGGGATERTPGLGAASEPVGGITVFEAVEKQLGLTLEQRKYPLPSVVIDHVERTPKEN